MSDFDLRPISTQSHFITWSLGDPEHILQWAWDAIVVFLIFSYFGRFESYSVVLRPTPTGLLCTTNQKSEHIISVAVVLNTSRFELPEEHGTIMLPALLLLALAALSAVQGQLALPVNICPVFLCAAPPPGCTYVPNDRRDANGCATSCGDLECNNCPIPGCRPPPEGCSYGTPLTNAEGCPIGCGPLVCPHCPVVPCAAPPLGCSYADPIIGDDGCSTNGCGELVCICLNIRCAPPRPGCSRGEPNRNENGCAIDCGAEICEVDDICPVFACAAPPDGCTYGPSPVDANGCATSCGTLQCEPDECLSFASSFRRQCPNPCNGAQCGRGHRCYGQRRKMDENGCVRCSSDYDCIRNFWWLGF